MTPDRHDHRPHTDDDDLPKIGQPLNAPQRRPLGRVLVATIVFFVVLVLLYLAAVQWLVD